MEFLWINKQGVRSDSEGFILQRQSRFIYQYIYEDHLMTIPVEDAAHYEEVYLSEVNGWEVPHNLEVIPEDELLKIRNQVIKALEFMNSTFKIL